MPRFTLGSCRRRKIQTLGLILLIVVIYYFLQFFSLSRLGGAGLGKKFRFKGDNLVEVQDDESKGKTGDDGAQDSRLSEKDEPEDGRVADDRQQQQQQQQQQEEKGKVPRGVNPDAAAQYAKDSSGRFKCLKSELHIPAEQVNDDFCDCPDSSDEPGTSACPSGRFYCKVQLPHQDAQFVPSSQVNDGICDCCDGSDEWQDRPVPAPMRLHGHKGAVFHTPCGDRCGNVLQLLQHEERVRRQGLILQQRYLDAAKELSPRHQHQFGPLGIFYLLSQECFQHAAHEYLYTVCPFLEVRQSRGSITRTVLGRQGKWTRQKPGDHILLMLGGDDTLCPDGNSRETQIRFMCGLEDRVISVSEDQRCRYLVRFSTPAAC